MSSRGFVARSQPFQSLSQQNQNDGQPRHHHTKPPIQLLRGKIHNLSIIFSLNQDSVIRISRSPAGALERDLKFVKMTGLPPCGRLGAWRRG